MTIVGVERSGQDKTEEERTREKEERRGQV
jgi:hypothetical protein